MEGKKFMKELFFFSNWVDYYSYIHYKAWKKKEKKNALKSSWSRCIFFSTAC